MNKIKNRVNLDQTLNFTQSSFAYKDPYQPRLSNPAIHLKNRLWSFLAFRNIENEFVDFKMYNVDRQFKEVYNDLSTAFKRNDKVVLQRSLSESMNQYTVSLIKAKKHSPFLRQVDSMATMQARVYHESDHLLPEE